MLNRLFLEEKIEFVSVIDYSDCREINPRLASRIPFKPQSVILFLLPYYTGETENISRYAASVDYHIIIKRISDKIIEKLKKIYPVSSFLPFGDHSPIDERTAAASAGLGFFGDNGLLINEKYGSYVFLADIITDIPKEELIGGGIRDMQASSKSACLHCGKCQKNCPTGILREKSGECLSAITQKKGALTPYDIELMKKVNTVWGCDICQSVCPYNAKAKKTPVSLFYEKRIEKLDLKTLDLMSEEEFAERAFAWRGREVPRRNLLAVEGKESKD